MLLLCLASCSNNNKSNVINHNSGNRYEDKEYTYTSISVNKDTIDIFAEKYIEKLYSTSPYFNFDSVRLMRKFSINKYGIDSINFDDNTEIDTIITATLKSDTLVFAKANSGIFLWKMKLHTNNIKIDTNIVIFNSKSVIYNLFNIDILYNNFCFLISGSGEYYEYTIKDGKVNMIVFQVDFEGVN